MTNRSSNAYVNRVASSESFLNWQVKYNIIVSYPDFCASVA